MRFLVLLALVAGCWSPFTSCPGEYAFEFGEKTCRDIHTQAEADRKCCEKAAWNAFEEWIAPEGSEK